MIELTPKHLSGIADDIKILVIHVIITLRTSIAMINEVYTYIDVALSPLDL